MRRVASVVLAFLLAGAAQAADPQAAARSAEWVCEAEAANNSVAVSVQLMLDGQGAASAIATKASLKGASEMPMVFVNYPVRAPGEPLVATPIYVSIGAFAPTPKRKGAETADIVIALDGTMFRRPWGLYSRPPPGAGAQSKNAVGFAGVIPFDEPDLLARFAKGGPVKVEVVAADGGALSSGAFTAPAPELLKRMADAALAQAQKQAATPKTACDKAKR